MPFLRRLVPALLASATLFLLPLPAHAEEGEEEEGAPEDLQKKIQEQMQKIVRLMRDNEQRLLEAARGGGERPGPVEVKPPDEAQASMAESSMAEPAMGEPAMGDPSMAEPSMADGAGTTPRERGEAIRRSIEELLEGVRRDGQRIPKEIEELIRMIPVRSGQGQGQKPEGDPQQGQTEAEKRNVADRKPEDGAPDSPEKPKDPAKSKEERGGQKPPDGEKGEETTSEVPPWIVTLPPEMRWVKTAADLEKFPEEHRPLLERYLKWQAENPGNRSR
jgi:hypothetical protein